VICTGVGGHDYRNASAIVCRIQGFAADSIKDSILREGDLVLVRLVEVKEAEELLIHKAISEPNEVYQDQAGCKDIQYSVEEFLSELRETEVMSSRLHLLLFVLLVSNYMSCFLPTGGKAAGT
jgi:hypothetical protein